MKSCGLSKQPLFFFFLTNPFPPPPPSPLTKYSRVDTARSFLRVVEAFLDVKSFEVLEEDFKAVFRVQYSLSAGSTSTFRYSAPSFQGRFRDQGSMPVNSPLSVTRRSSAVGFDGQYEMRSVYKVFFLLA